MCRGSHRTIWSLAVFVLLGCFLAMPGVSRADEDHGIWGIRIKEVHLQEATLPEAVEYIRQRTATENCTGDHRPINIVVKDPAGSFKDAKRVSLELHDVKLTAVLRYLAATADLKLSVEPFALMLMPKSDQEPQYTRTFKVPPDFLRAAFH